MNENYLKKMDAYWRAANYLSAAQLYLLDKSTLRKKSWDTGERFRDRILSMFI